MAARTPPAGMLPSIDDLASDSLTHRWGDLFNPPGLTNGWGCLQADMDVMALRHITFPPFSQGDTQTALLLVDGRSPSMEGVPVTFRWFPDRIERQTRFDGLLLKTTTVLGVQRRLAIVRLEIRNAAGRPREASLDLRLGGGVVQDTDSWRTPHSPQEGLRANRVQPIPKWGAVEFASTGSTAFSLQGMSPAPRQVDGLWLRHRITLARGAVWKGYYANVIGADRDRLGKELWEMLRRPEAAMRAASDFWQKQIHAAFTPGNGRFSGHLPLLATRDAPLRRLYWNVAATLLCFHRRSPSSRVGVTYTTRMPRYWVTTSFVGDTGLAAGGLAHLDPQVLRSMLEHWLELDPQDCCGSNYLTGGPVGTWYGVNDHALCLLAKSYLQVTGDRGWLAKKVDRRTIQSHLQRAATSWKKRDLGRKGLADYGDRNTLLECVCAYRHEVASLNAAAAWNHRFIGSLLQDQGRPGAAAAYRAIAGGIAANVLKKLYRKGEGFFSCGQPDGTMVPTRHIWDLGFVLTTIDEDLKKMHRREMSRFFVRELQSPAWCRALSPSDDDAGSSLRADQQWNGSFSAWPALACRGLFRISRPKLALSWLRGLAGSANQGPLGQAHFVEGAAPAESGGALKAPAQWPFLCDWAHLSSAAFFDLFTESLFGIRAGATGAIRHEGLARGFDPSARLLHFAHQGRSHTISSEGIETEASI